MVQAIGAQNTIAADKITDKKPVNILDRAKTKAGQFKDVFVKSDDSTQAKVNTALASASVLGSLVMLFGHKSSVARWLGGVVSLLSGLSLAALNFSKSALAPAAQKTVNPETVIPSGDTVMLSQEAQNEQAAPAPDTAEANALNLIASNDPAKSAPEALIKQTTQG